MPQEPHTSAATSGSACPPVEDTGDRCVECGYNLTGLTADVCPECGCQIDWELARSGVEGRRVGTPAHRARGRRKVDQTLMTVMVMLFTPWRFARQVRTDEAIWPSLIVAVLCCLSVAQWYLDAWGNLLIEAATAVLPVSAVILAQSLVFATLCFRQSADSPRWYARFRLWLIVSFYSTCFVAGWTFVEAPPLVSSLSDTTFVWPLNPSSLIRPDWGVTIIFYWWWAVLATVLLIRNRPRWLAGLLIPLVFPFTWLGSVVAQGTVQTLWPYLT